MTSQNGLHKFRSYACSLSLSSLHLFGRSLDGARCVKTNFMQCDAYTANPSFSTVRSNNYLFAVPVHRVKTDICVYMKREYR